MSRRALIMLLCLPACLLAAEGYKVTRPDGSVEFSDVPVKGAEKIKLPKAQGYQSTERGSATPNNGGEDKKKEPTADYQRFAITAPAAEQMITYDETGIGVSVAVAPGLRPAHQVIIYIDGQEVARGGATSFRVKAVERGAHVLSASIVDGGGARVQEAAAITFHIFQRSLIQQQGPSPGGGLVQPK